MLMKRLAIYAAFDKNDEVDEVDIFYLEALKECVENIIYVCDNPLKNGEKEKLDGLCNVVLADKHGEYDFGSYKRGYLYAKEYNMLENVDELIFCNDSCYAPFNSFEKMFNRMSNKNCDFWGVAENTDIARHIQSYFIVFKPTIFNSTVFNDFINSIVAQPTLYDIIVNYEVGLSQTLLKAGFVADSYIFADKKRRKFKKFHNDNLTLFPVWFIRQGSPLLKKKALTLKTNNKEGILRTLLFAKIKNRKLIKLRDYL